MEPIVKRIKMQENVDCTQIVNLDEIAEYLGLTNQEVLNKLSIGFGCCIRIYENDEKYIHGVHDSKSVKLALGL